MFNGIRAIAERLQPVAQHCQPIQQATEFLGKKFVESNLKVSGFSADFGNGPITHETAKMCHTALNALPHDLYQRAVQHVPDAAQVVQHLFN